MSAATLTTATAVTYVINPADVADDRLVLAPGPIAYSTQVPVGMALLVTEEAIQDGIQQVLALGRS